MNEVLKAIKSRRSIRKYKPDQISPENLDLIIEAGVYAPSAENNQPWHFTVVQNRELLERIDAVTREVMAGCEVDWIRSWGSNPHFRVTYAAPTLIVVSGRRCALDWQTDCAAAIQNMLLAAESLKIGSVWLGLLKFYFSREEEVRRLGIPAGYEPFYGVAFGYKAREMPCPQRNLEVVNFIR